MAFVEFRDVSKIYQMGEVPVAAVRDMSFDIEQGSSTPSSVQDAAASSFLTRLCRICRINFLSPPSLPLTARGRRRQDIKKESNHHDFTGMLYRSGRKL